MLGVSVHLHRPNLLLLLLLQSGSLCQSQLACIGNVGDVGSPGASDDDDACARGLGGLGRGLPDDRGLERLGLPDELAKRCLPMVNNAEDWLGARPLLLSDGSCGNACV